MNITLNQPVLPYDINQYYKEFLLGLIDGELWDRGQVAVPYTKPAFGPAFKKVVAQNNTGGILTGVNYYVITATLVYTDPITLEQIIRETLISREISADISGFNSAQLTWEAYPGADYYTVYRSETSGDYRNELLATNITGTTYVDLGSETSSGVPVAQQIKISGSISPVGVYVVSLMNVNGNGDPGIFQQLTSNPDGTFEFNVSVPLGTNKFFAQVGVDYSASVFINAYNLHAYFHMLGEELLTYWQPMIERINAAPHLFAVPNILDGNSTLSEIQDFVSFWQTMTSVIRPSGISDTNFRALLITVIRAYRLGTSYAALKDVIQALLPNWISSSFIPLDVYNSGFRLGKGSTQNVLGKFKVVGPPSLTYSWNDGTGFVPYVVGNTRGYIAGGTNTIGSEPSVTRWEIVYIDGTLDGNGYFVMTVLEVLVNPNFNQVTLPDGAIVLAIVKVVDDVITWISGQSFLGSLVPEGQEWTLLGDGSFVARYFFSLLEFNNKIWLFAGDVGLNDASDVWSSPDGMGWMQATASAQFSARLGYTVLNYQNKMWIIGGLDDSSTTLSDVWNSVDGINWTQVTQTVPFPARFGHTSVVFGGKMWIIGGSGVSGGIVNDVYYSTDGATWTQVLADNAFPGPTQFTQRLGHSSVVFNGLMWVIGGLGTGNVELNDVWSSPDGLTWTQVTASSAWDIRNFQQVVVFNDKMYLIGGDTTHPGVAYFNDVWSSDDGITWTLETASAPFVARTKFGMINFKNAIYVVGGIQSGAVITNDVWKSSPALPPSGVGTGPYLVGPSFITDRARLNSRGYKYSRMVIYLSTLDPNDTNYDIYVEMLTNLLEQLKPAKMTILLGYPPNNTYQEIYNSP